MRLSSTCVLKKKKKERGGKGFSRKINGAIVVLGASARGVSFSCSVCAERIIPFPALLHLGDITDVMTDFNEKHSGLFSITEAGLRTTQG